MWLPLYTLHSSGIRPVIGIYSSPNQLHGEAGCQVLMAHLWFSRVAVASYVMLTTFKVSSWIKDAWKTSLYNFQDQFAHMRLEERGMTVCAAGGTRTTKPITFWLGCIQDEDVSDDPGIIIILESAFTGTWNDKKICRCHLKTLIWRKGFPDWIPISHRYTDPKFLLKLFWTGNIWICVKS